MDRQTPVKILPCPKLCLRAIIIEQIVDNDHRKNVAKFEKMYHSILEYFSDKVGFQAH